MMRLTRVCRYLGTCAWAGLDLVVVQAVQQRVCDEASGGGGWRQRYVVVLAGNKASPDLQAAAAQYSGMTVAEQGMMGKGVLSKGCPSETPRHHRTQHPRHLTPKGPIIAGPRASKQASKRPATSAKQSRASNCRLHNAISRGQTSWLSRSIDRDTPVCSPLPLRTAPSRACLRKGVR